MYTQPPLEHSIDLHTTNYKAQTQKKNTVFGRLPTHRTCLTFHDTRQGGVRAVPPSSSDSLCLLLSGRFGCGILPERRSLSRSSIIYSSAHTSGQQSPFPGFLLAAHRGHSLSCCRAMLDGTQITAPWLAVRRTATTILVVRTIRYRRRCHERLPALV